jgi:hypothetical protein
MGARPRVHAPHALEGDDPGDERATEDNRRYEDWIGAGAPGSDRVHAAEDTRHWTSASHIAASHSPPSPDEGQVTRPAQGRRDSAHDARRLFSDDWEQDVPNGHKDEVAATPTIGNEQATTVTWSTRWRRRASRNLRRWSFSTTKPGTTFIAVVADAQHQRRRPPWWRLATLILLSVALAIALSQGRTIEAVIIGILIVPTLLLVGAWIYVWIGELPSR